MNKKLRFTRTCMILAGLASLSMMASGCVEKYTDDQYYELVCADNGSGEITCDKQYTTKAFVIRIDPTIERGSASDPLPFLAPKWKRFDKNAKVLEPTAFCPTGSHIVPLAASDPLREPGMEIGIAAYAVDVHGNFNPNFNGEVAVKSVPGELNVQTLRFKNGLLGKWENASDPVNSNPTSYEKVELRFAYGPTRLWLEDGVANRHGILQGTLATGVSDEFVFEDQTIHSIQYNPDVPDGVTPLLKQFGDVKAKKGHDLVVSNVVSTGFYVTDVGEDGIKDGYNSIFIYSYSQPARVDIGDRICEVTGGIAEFTGMTQMQFPSWGIQNKERSTAEDTDPAPEDGDKGAGYCVDKETGMTRECTEEELANMAEIVDCWAEFEPERARECLDSNLEKKYPNQAEHDAAKQQCKAEKNAFAYIQPPQPLELSWQVLMCGADGNAVNKDDGMPNDQIQCTKLESMEGSIVTLTDIDLSNYFIDCDDNGNGKIDSNSDESSCRNDCNNNPRCSEYSSLESYDQWKARAKGTISGSSAGEESIVTSEISVASSALIAGFNILDGCITIFDDDLRKNTFCQKRKFKRLTGTLKQVLPGCYAKKVNCGECFSSYENFTMAVIEPRFGSDVIEDVDNNATEKTAFEACSKACEKSHDPDTDKKNYIACMMQC